MLGIPGYKIEHELGRGGMAKVYLALQESVQRRVALKVMSPVLLVDPSFSARFMREARIAANLNHPHIVAVFNVGAHQDNHFIAMEYVPGGDLAVRCIGGMPVLEALRVTAEIAGALDYAHAKGFVHRDVKPENILFRDNGSTVLTDFGIARATNSNTQMTKTGAVIGTPQYMSPEQARGKDLDGRSDLYGLGIVLYEMLTGKVPYEGSDSVAVGIKHVTEPLPRLPGGLIQVQPLLERFLAKDPNHRYQTGDEAVLDIQRMEKVVATERPVRIKLSPDAGMNTTFTDPPTVPMPTPVPGTHDTDKNKSGDKIAGKKKKLTPVSATPRPDGSLRQEPTLGSMDDFSSFDRTVRHPSQVDDARRAKKPVNTGGSGKWLVGLLILAALAAAGWWQRDLLIGLMPSEEVAILLDRAEAASQLGQMYGNSDRHASHLYQMVLDIDPDNGRARNGMQRVAEYLIRQSEKASRAGRPQQATFFWERARELNPKLPENPPAIEQLVNQQVVPTGSDTGPGSEPDTTAITNLLADGMRLIIEERLLQPADENALSKFQAVLAIDPNNEAALDGIGQIADRIGESVDQAFAAEDLARVAQQIERLVLVGHNQVQVADYRSRLLQAQSDLRSRQQAVSQRQDQIDNLLGRAAAALSADRLANPASDNAVHWYRKVQEMDAGNEAARKGLSSVARRYLVLTEQALEDDRLEDAAGHITQIQQIEPGLAGLGTVRNRLTLYREQRELRQVSARQEQEIRELLADAQVAFDKGDLMSPPGNSAYDRYKDVLRMDPDHEEARQGLRRLSTRLAELARDAMLAGDFQFAAAVAGDAQQTDPQNPSVLTLVPELATRVRNEVLEAITQGRLNDAENLLQMASNLEPNHPQVSRLRLQLSVAKG